MDVIWDCMNIASRISKYIESSDNWVPKSQTKLANPLNDLQELITTINSVRTIFVPFVTATKKVKTGDSMFELSVKGIQSVLQELQQYFKELEKDFSINTWKTQRVKIYQMDFSLKQKLDQFAALFAYEEPQSQKKKDPKPITVSSVIPEADAREFWVKSFGDQVIFFSVLNKEFNGSMGSFHKCLGFGGKVLTSI